MGGNNKDDVVETTTTTAITSEVPQLLDDQDDFFIEKAEAALNEIFARYDDDKNDALTIDQLNAFAVQCNGKPFDKESLDSIQEAFECTDAGLLTKRGFLEMYYMQTISDPAETWRDISAHGYNTELDLVSSQ
eukprot:gene9112-10685_t